MRPRARRQAVEEVDTVRRWRAAILDSATIADPIGALEQLRRMAGGYGGSATNGMALQRD